MLKIHSLNNLKYIKWNNTVSNEKIIKIAQKIIWRGTKITCIFSIRTWENKL
jgi:hypothetical protein